MMYRQKRGDDCSKTLLAGDTPSSIGQSAGDLAISEVINERNVLALVDVA